MEEKFEDNIVENANKVREEENQKMENFSKKKLAAYIDSLNEQAALHASKHGIKIESSEDI